MAQNTGSGVVLSQRCNLSKVAIVRHENKIKYIRFCCSNKSKFNNMMMSYRLPTNTEPTRLRNNDCILAVRPIIIHHTKTVQSKNALLGFQTSGIFQIDYHRAINQLNSSKQSIFSPDTRELTCNFKYSDKVSRILSMSIVMEGSKSTSEEDQIVSTLGDIGPWQRRILGLTAIFCVPLSAHIMVMTFMNAKVVFWTLKYEF